MIFDSDVLIDVLREKDHAKKDKMLAAIFRTPERLISIVTWWEVLGGVCGKYEDTKRFLRTIFDVILIEDLNDTIERIMEAYAGKHQRIEAMDAIIMATVKKSTQNLCTKNRRHFLNKTLEGNPHVLTADRIKTLEY